MERNDAPGRASAPARVRVTDVTGDPGVEEARARFGGIDIPPTLAGALAALGTAALLAGVLAGAGTYGYQLGIDNAEEKLTAGGLIGGLATLFIAFLVGGWVAGRVARYLGGRLGERYHRRADALVAQIRTGAVGTPQRIVRAS